MKAFGISILIFVSCRFIFCNDYYQSQTINRQINYPIDTFRLKYKAEIHGRVKLVNENIYVGLDTQVVKIGNTEYRKFIFGKSLAGIALVKYDEDKLSYINTKYYKNVPLIGGDSTGILLYFNKQINDKWKVNIDSSYFWRKEISFAGIDSTGEEKIYVYNIEEQEGFSEVGDQLNKIYFSKSRGFLKFVFKTHWFPVEVNKL